MQFTLSTYWNARGSCIYHTASHPHASVYSITSSWNVSSSSSPAESLANSSIKTLPWNRLLKKTFHARQQPSSPQAWVYAQNFGLHNSPHRWAQIVEEKTEGQKGKDTCPRLIHTEVCENPVLKEDVHPLWWTGIGTRKEKDAAARPHPGVSEEKVGSIGKKHYHTDLECRDSWPWSWLPVVRTKSSDSYCSCLQTVSVPSDSHNVSCLDHSSKEGPSTWVSPQHLQWFCSKALRRTPFPEKKKHRTRMWVSETTLNTYVYFSFYFFWWKGETPRARTEGKAKTQKERMCKLWKGHWSKVWQV